MKKASALSWVVAAYREGLQIVVTAEGRLDVRPPGLLADALMEALRRHEARIVAVMQLRDAHLAMMSEDDMRFVEVSLLASGVPVRLLSRPPELVC